MPTGIRTQGTSPISAPMIGSCCKWIRGQRQPDRGRDPSRLPTMTLPSPRGARVLLPAGHVDRAGMCSLWSSHVCVRLSEGGAESSVEEKGGRARSQGWGPALRTLPSAREELLQRLNLNLPFQVTMKEYLSRQEVRTCLFVLFCFLQFVTLISIV